MTVPVMDKWAAQLEKKLGYTNHKELQQRKYKMLSHEIGDAIKEKKKPVILINPINEK